MTGTGSAAVVPDTLVGGLRAIAGGRHVLTDPDLTAGVLFGAG